MIVASGRWVPWILLLASYSASYSLTQHQIIRLTVSAVMRLKNPVLNGYHWRKKDWILYEATQSLAEVADRLSDILTG